MSDDYRRLNQDLKGAYIELRTLRAENRSLRTENKRLDSMSLNPPALSTVAPLTVNATASATAAPPAVGAPLAQQYSASMGLGFPLSTLRNFDGDDTTNIQDWLEQFDKLSGGLGIRPDRQAELIRIFLVGPAERVYRSYPADIKANFRALYARLCTEFSKPEHAAAAAKTFQERRQLVGESVLAYACALEKLFQQAYGATADKQVRRDGLLRGLRAELNRAIVYHDNIPMAFDELLKYICKELSCICVQPT